MTPRSSAARAASLLVAIAALAACDKGEMTPDWSRMISQPKLLPYGTSDLFPDQRAMRPLPAGVVARGRMDDPVRRTGRDDAGADAAAVPLPITRALLDRGRNRFAIACAPCHGVAGDGNAVVAHDMQRRRPPSLHERRITALTPGAMYRVITQGYGLMPSYDTLLVPDDRWAVIAYVRTLELAWTARLDALPPQVRDDIARRLP
jgi:mono/diheme cytochrome c family protein